MTQHAYNTIIIGVVLLFVTWLAFKIALALIKFTEGMKPGETKFKEIKILPRTWFILEVSATEDGKLDVECGFATLKR